ncbi:MBL fold metallo-hydrolase [Pseudonocardia sp. RS11V-5]|uniref:MBL fold metallo-hydrolase n=1 Tax=Pseudonocardia terrae TaxID=2905831 RepID=UPI001E53B5CB|nr:MBL fold metallo-hydrolase [Pseudonocardia terrae]MCE3556228.1 MBL fold metallo-hydrolase [Pseudonocardia terrae]
MARTTPLPLRTGVLTALALAATGGLAAAGAAAWGIPRAMGAPPEELRRVADESPHARDGRFRNTEPGTALPSGTVPAALRAVIGRRAGRPSRPVPLARPEPGPADELAVTWFGHSSVLLEIDGRRVLADPVWGDRVSPSRLVGPRRMHPAPVPLTALPPVDAVVISHDHYDHLDLPTVRALVADPRHGAAPFLVPLGIGAHLRAWGVPEDRIVELDWDGRAEVAGLTLVCAEARHFSGRGLQRDTTLWSSWAVLGPRHRAYFGGDTGYTTAFARAGERWGPFDATFLPIGAYADLWPDIHMNPEESVAAHRDLRGGVLLPVHWATFNLGFHPWSEPVTRLRAAAETAGIPLALPVPGQRIDLTGPAPATDWWTPVA